MRKICLSLLVAALCLTFVATMSAATNVLTNAQSSTSKPVVIPSLRDLLANQPQDLPFGYHTASPVQYPKAAQQALNQKMNFAAQKDGLAAGSVNAPDAIPTKITDWLGVGTGFHGYRVPDAPTDGQVSIGDSPCQVVQWVNVQFAAFDCNGNSLTGGNLGLSFYNNGNVLFTGLAHCGASNSGDIIVQFDKIAHRWVMYQPRFSAPYYDCFAISQTGDFMGAWYLYEFPTFNNSVDFPDYPKVGVWPNGYYVSHNDFPNLASYAGAMPCAYERTAMLAGQTAGGGCFLDNSNGTLFDDSMLPSDLDSPNNLPPGGSPNIFFGSIDNFASDSNIYYYHFKVTTFQPFVATFDCVNGACKIPVNTYSNAAGTAPEPGGSVIDTLSDRLMYRAAYRVLPGLPSPNNQTPSSTTQQWLMSHAVNNGGHSAVRWYEFRAPSGNTTPTTFQQGTYDPADGQHRFMSSLAADKKGNIAMSYTVTGSAAPHYPTIAFTGRSIGDPAGTMGAETLVIAGTGSQTDTSNRWGDYYNMAISNDGCTFVTMGEYYTSNSSFNWNTRVATLKFNGCN